VTSFSWKYFFVPAVALVGLVSLFWKGLRPSPVIKFAGAWFALTLLPVIAEFRWVQLHDRHLYLPSFGAAILFVALLRRFHSVELHLSGGPLAFLILLAIAMTVLSASEVRIWRSSEEVFSRAVDVAPRNPEAVGQLAETFFTTGQHEKAFAVLKQGITLIPHSARLYFSLGDYYFEDGRYEEAQPYLEKVRSLPPDLTSAVSGAEYDLGIIEWKRGNTEAAEHHLRAAVAGAPQVAGYRRTLERLTFSVRIPDARPQ
jgi:tetratricopeptide (TPR) repeat protein